MSMGSTAEAGIAAVLQAKVFMALTHRDHFYVRANSRVCKRRAFGVCKTSGSDSIGNTRARVMAPSRVTASDEGA